MEEAVVKQGVLYLQLQQTFGKQKWKRFWGVLYRDSSCSTARLELFEGSSPPAPEKLRKGEGSKKLVKLSDCVHVAEVSSNASCPRETTPFLLETTDKRYLLAAAGTEAAVWIQQLCELAFPEQAAGKDGQQTLLGTNSDFSMEENSLYSSRGKAGLEQAFEVTVRATESSERCQLRGQFLLRAGEEALELQHFQTLELLYRWPYRFLRRFGRDKVTFSFEAGRRCASGEGSFEFETPEGNEIFQAIEAAISLHRGRAAEEPRPGGPGDDASSWPQGHQEPGGTKCPSLEPGWEGRVPKAKPATTPCSCPGCGEPSGTFLSCRGADVPHAEHCTSPRRAPPQVPEKSWRQEAAARGAAEPNYAVPFDTIAKNLMACQLGSLGQHPRNVSDPVYASIREAEGQEGSQPPPPPKPYHIYDEPEGLSPHSVYDEPQEVKGEAWKLQAAPEEPSGHQYPYNPQRDDYAVPKRPVPLRQPFPLRGKEWLGDADYNNVAPQLAKKRNLQ
ncbi:docking protein 2 isoform X1 [Melanerpes formicivorus]|uniref:docking protein 2 isoform X1 n=1 Tax=Melanerpes formicivorus TaxID=211600 RepID=UPI00358F2812